MTFNNERLKFLLRALRYRNFRLFFAGQSFSLTGSWMQTIAVSWLVYRLTSSPVLLGVVAFASQIPIFFLTPFAGVLADSWDRRRVLIITQTLSMIQAFALAFLALSGLIHPWHIIVLSLFIGFVNAFDVPMRQAFVIDMVEDKAELSNAIALNSLIFNGARLLGPSVAGILIATVGEGVCFLLNGLSFFAVIFALKAMTIQARQEKAGHNHVLQGLKEGLVYAYTFKPIRFILLLIALVSLMGMSYAVLMPIFAKDILGGGPRTLGFLMAASGVGAVAGAVYLASRTSAQGLERIAPLATALFGASLAAVSLSRLLSLSLVLMAFVGFGMIVQMVSSNTLLQTLTDDDKRGRVMSLFTISFMGMAPFGSLIAGGLAKHIGAPNAVLASGLACIIGAAFFYSKRSSLKKAIQIPHQP